MDVGGGRVATSTEPVVGWRYWQVTRAGRLRSVTQKFVEWQPGTPLRAVCLELHHPAPADDCACGVYANGELEDLRQHGLCLAPGAAVVVGRVALWGRVVADGPSWRGELASPCQLSVVAGTTGEQPPELLVARLEAYGVPVSVVALDEALAGATADMLRFQAMALSQMTAFSQATDEPSRRPPR